MISRVANRRRGMNELDIMRLIQAFVISLIIYSFLYLRVLKAGEHKIDRVIRVTLKKALNLPPWTLTERLLQMGLHNTVSELCTSHESSHAPRHH